MTPPNATPTRADVLREPNDLAALAEACERVTAYANAECSCQPCEDARLLRAHARALREGRVTVNEGGPDA
ncbi:MAG: hypothetical protein ABS52_16615 [Gemmatimonadetes bacterium SCN 70-22]|nr:MAG: hypothetical protein ABS52_16615 [Gemmatimonadetes bacterium SCN 70-22]